MDYRRLENRIFVSLDGTNDRSLMAPNTGRALCWCGQWVRGRHTDRGPYLTTITCCGV